MSISSSPRSDLNNQLLASLSANDFARLEPNLKSVWFNFGEVIYETGDRIKYVYFPTTAIISQLYTMENGSTAETGIIGKDGLSGIALFLGSEIIPNREIVHIAGNALRMEAKTAQNEFLRGGTFQRILLRYTQALMRQISQTAICNRLHCVEQHFCRWLLINHDLIQRDKLRMTHESIAILLGARRGSISEAAGRLQSEGLISYVRGTIKVLDRKGLEARVCECFQVVKDEYIRLFGN
ncbi:Crp/Fnr family transcriptional regulator [soil metagenome]